MLCYSNFNNIFHELLHKSFMSTIKDVANRAGVSTATVSRVLNNHNAVNEATRRAVLQAVEELDYDVERLRSTPKTHRSVLVLTRDNALEDSQQGQNNMREFERTVWNAVHSVLKERGFHARLQQSGWQDADMFIDDPSVAGLILVGGIIDPDFLQTLLEREMPFVIAGAYVPPLQLNVVMADVGQGIRQATTHLLEHGYDRIGLVNGPATTATSQEKLEALQLAYCLNHLSFEPDCVVISDFSSESGYRQTHELLNRRPDLNALIYADDMIAIGGLRAIKESGRRIPHDLAVVGFGNYELAKFTDPPLTSIHFDMHAMGVMAAQRLHMLIDENDQYPWLIRVPTTLQIRSST